MIEFEKKWQHYRQTIRFQKKEVNKMFQTGDYVMYGKTGVCRIENIGEYSFGEGIKPHRYYKLSPVFSRGDVIYVPVDGCAHMRSVVDREEAQDCIRRFPGIQPRIFRSRVQRQVREHYETMLETYDVEVLLELMKEVYAKRAEAAAHNKKFGQVDEHFLKSAEKLACGELAVVLDASVDSIRARFRREMREEEKHMI